MGQGGNRERAGGCRPWPNVASTAKRYPPASCGLGVVRAWRLPGSRRTSQPSVPVEQRIGGLDCSNPETNRRFASQSLMSILVDKNTRLLVQGMGKAGTFHAI